MRLRIAMSVFVSLLLSIGCPWTDVRGDDQKELIQKAKQEGEAVLYTPMAADLTQRLVAGFKRRYPFLQLNIQKANSEVFYNRILLEHRAGRVLADVVALTTTPLLKEHGFLAEYRTPEAAAYPSKFKDPDHTWVGQTGTYYVIGYNTKLVDKSVAPRDWQDLTQERWKGKIAMDTEEHRWYGAMLEYFGTEKGRELMTSLASQQIHWRSGHSLLAQLVVAGEFNIALVYAHRTQLLKNAGAPIEWVKTAKPVVVGVNSAAVLKAARHPASARLLMDFLLSREGQTALLERGHSPLRPDVIPEDSPFYPEKMELFPTSHRVMSRLNELQVEFNSIFSPR